MIQKNKRYCTLPKIPWFRDWYEKKFGSYCKDHDEDYAKGYRGGGCKTCADLKLAYKIAMEGHPFTAILTLIVLIIWLPLWFRWLR